MRPLSKRQVKIMINFLINPLQNFLFFLKNLFKNNDRSFSDLRKTSFQLKLDKILEVKFSPLKEIRPFIQEGLFFYPELNTVYTPCFFQETFKKNGIYDKETLAWMCKTPAKEPRNSDSETYDYLNSTPLEIWFHICSYVHPIKLIVLMNTCKLFNEITQKKECKSAIDQFRARIESKQLRGKGNSIDLWDFFPTRPETLFSRKPIYSEPGEHSFILRPHLTQD